jgi:hypothetical protein
VPEIDETLTILRKTSRPSSRSFLAGSRRCGAAARDDDVDVQHALEPVVAHPVDRRVERVAGVVDDDVDLAPRVDRRLHESVGRALGREVARVDGRLAVDGIRRLLGDVAVEVVEDDLRAVLAEQLGGRPADPPGAPGDDRDLVVQDCHARLLVRWRRRASY